MEKGLAEAVLKMYHNVSGNRHFTAEDVCDEFSRLVIDKPLHYGSRIKGKVDSRGHILEKDLNEESIDELLTRVLAEV